MPETRLKRGELERRVMEFLRQGPATVRDCARGLNHDFFSVRTTVRRMAADGLLVCQEKSARSDADEGRVGRPAQVYALAEGLMGGPVHRPVVPEVRVRDDGTATPAPYATGFRWWNVSW